MDIGSIATVGASLKTAGEILKAMVGLRDGAMIQDKAIELQRVILAAQSDALAAQADQFALLKHVGALETQIAQMEAWGSEKQRYQLQQIDMGCYAYTLKPGMGGAEPPHWLCPACYQHSKKSIFQLHGQSPDDHRMHVFRCPECSASVTLADVIYPGQENEDLAPKGTD